MEVLDLRSYKPTSPSRRHLRQICLRKNDGNTKIKKFASLKNLKCSINPSYGKQKKNGICVKGKQSGCKNRFIVLDKFRNNTFGILVNYEKVLKQGFLVGIFFNFITKKFFYNLVIKNTKIGTIVTSNNYISINEGSSSYIKNIPTTFTICLLSSNQSSKSMYSCSPGSKCYILQKKGNLVLVQLPSGNIKHVNLTSLCTVGSIQSDMHKLQKLGKAGRNRWLGKRPKVRGVAMNPVDHPHGGGEGKTSGGRPSVSPWGVPIFSKKRKAK